MSLYSEFYKEVIGWETLETDEYFITYQLNETAGIKSLKIVNMFIAKEQRGKGKSFELVEMMEKKAREEGCLVLSANISKDSHAFIQQRTTHIARMCGMELMYEDVYNIVYGRRL
jgi:hypothetical protein